jgi:predicted class III extradiol MEMO1 family dioxygenase
VNKIVQKNYLFGDDKKILKNNSGKKINSGTFCHYTNSNNNKLIDNILIKYLQKFKQIEKNS